jgi:hypothetical protein
MILLAVQSLALLVAAPAQDLPARLRHLESMAAAWAPAPSRDVTRIAFLTTLFGTRQAASMAIEGSYPNQLTDEPGGVESIAWVPPEARMLVATVLRDGHRRLILVDEDASVPVPIDAAAGEQLLGGFSRDGKRLYYAVVDAGKVTLRTWAVETRTATTVTPPPPAAGVQPPKDSLPLDDALSALVSLGPPSPDGRTLLAQVKRGGGEGVALVDLAAARGTILTPTDAPARFRQPRFSGDAKSVYVLTDAGRSTLGVDSIAVQGHARKTLYAPPENIEAFAITDDGHRLAVALEINGMNLFSLLDLPSLRPQPLAAPPSGALAEGGMVWDRPGERLFFGWRLPDDTTDVWELRLGYGTAMRLTRSPRPGLPRESISRPALVKIGDSVGWLWRPSDPAKPRVAVLIRSRDVRPVFDRRVAALNMAGLAVLAMNGKDPQKAARDYLSSAQDLDIRFPLLLNPDDLPVEDAAKWGGVVSSSGKTGLTVDPDHPDLKSLVNYATSKPPGL